MPNTLTLVKGVTGQSGPNAVGEWAEEIWQVVGDGATPNITITPVWLRLVSAFDCGPGFPAVTAITFPGTFVAFPSPTFTITCGNLPAFPIFIFLRGIWR